MLAKLREHLATLGRRIVGDKRSLAIAQRRWKANHVRAVANHRAGKDAERLAAKMAAQHHPLRQAAEEAKAGRCHARAWRAHRRAEYWVDVIRRLTARIEHWQTASEVTRERIESIGPTVDLANNKVTGGTPRQRLRVAMHTSMRVSREFYSQAGTWSVAYFLTGPPYGYRFDCSSWFTSGYYCCGLPDPNGLNYNGGYTGSLAEHGKAISESELDDGDAVLYGYQPYRHVEMKDGPMSKSPFTVGHGTSAVDRGSVGMIPGPRTYRRYT